MSHNWRRSPCRVCGGPKPAGRGRIICESCGEFSNVPADQQDEIVQLYVHEQLPIPVISRRVFWSPGTVWKVLRLHGVQTSRSQQVRPNTPSDDEIARVTELYLSGIPVQQISSMLGMEEMGVWRRLSKAGVRKRSRSDAARLGHLARIALNGHAALTDRQARALAFVEQAPATSPQVAAHLGLPTPDARAVLRQLARFGLVQHHPAHKHGLPSSWSRTRLPVRDVLERAVTPNVQFGKAPNDEMLPIGPFREWVENWIAREERRAQFSGIDPTQAAVSSRLAQRLGMTERRLWAIRNEQPRIALSTADRYLTRAECGVRLEDLWPHLAVDDDLEVAA